MNERIRQLAEQHERIWNLYTIGPVQRTEVEGFVEAIVRECADVCMEMAAKCAGLPGDGALARDCADWIKKDFGVE